MQKKSLLREFKIGKGLIFEGELFFLKEIPGMMMTQMRKRRIPAVQKVSRKRKLDPEDFLLEGKSGA